MKLTTDSFEHRGKLPDKFAAGIPTADGYGFGENFNPHLCWSDAPEGTQSFAMIMMDPDVPTHPEMVGVPDVEIPVRQARTVFTHWLLIDIDKGTSEILEGQHSKGVTPRGKDESKGPGNSRQGLNDYTGWFANDRDMAGDWFGYDGPFPPPNDLREHRYFFRLFALDVQTLDVPEKFTASDVLKAMRGHILAEDAIYGTYTLHPKLRAKG